MRKFLWLLILAIAAPARAAAGEGTGFETAIGGGVSGLVAADTSHQYETSRSYVGPAALAGVYYHAGHPLVPWVELGYWTLYASTQSVPQAGNPDLAASGSLRAWSVIAGGGYELGNFRLRAGLGTASLRVASDFGAAALTSAEFATTVLAAAEYAFLDSPSAKGWIGVRGISFLAPGIGALSLSLSISHDWR